MVMVIWGLSVKCPKVQCRFGTYSQALSTQYPLQNSKIRVFVCRCRIPSNWSPTIEAQHLQNEWRELTTTYRWTSCEITSWVQDFRKITHHFRGIYEIYLKLIVHTFTCCNCVSVFKVFSLILSPLWNWSAASTKLSLFRTWSAMAARVLHLYLWLSLSLPLLTYNTTATIIAESPRERERENIRIQSSNMNTLNQCAVQMFYFKK